MTKPLNLLQEMEGYLLCECCLRAGETDKQRQHALLTGDPQRSVSHELVLPLYHCVLYIEPHTLPTSCVEFTQARKTVEYPRKSFSSRLSS